MARSELGVAPFAGPPAGQEVALDHAAPLGQAVESEAHDADGQAPTRRGVLEPKRSVRAGVARHELRHRLGAFTGLEKRRGQPGRRHDAERVAESPRVLRRGEARFSRDRGRQ